MTWIQRNILTLVFGAITLIGSGASAYAISTSNNAVMATRLDTVEKVIATATLQSDRIMALQLSVNSLESRQNETMRYWGNLSSTMSELTKVVQEVHTSIEVFNERWTNHETRLNNCEDNYLPSRKFP